MIISVCKCPLTVSYDPIALLKSPLYVRLHISPSHCLKSSVRFFLMLNKDVQGCGYALVYDDSSFICLLRELCELP